MKRHAHKRAGATERAVSTTRPFPGSRSDGGKAMSRTVSTAKAAETAREEIPRKPRPSRLRERQSRRDPRVRRRAPGSTSMSPTAESAELASRRGRSARRPAAPTSTAARGPQNNGCEDVNEGGDRDLDAGRKADALPLGGRPRDTHDQHGDRLSEPVATAANVDTIRKWPRRGARPRREQADPR